MANLTNFDYKMFEEARKMAKTSDFPDFKLGAVLVYKHKILSYGANSTKTHPRQCYFNGFRNFREGSGPIRHSLHAEMSAILSVPYIIGKNVNWSKVKIYIYRISKGHPSKRGLSKPCAGCERAIRDLGIKHVYYTTDNGYAYERYMYD